MRKPNEERFEKHIEQTLIGHGYTSRLYTEYDRNQCQLQEEFIEFIKSTQKEEYDKLYKQFDTSTDKQLSKIVNDQIHIICKNNRNRLIQFKFDEAMIFQKLSPQEKVILNVLDYLNA